jgi:hypothetical protein
MSMWMRKPLATRQCPINLKSMSNTLLTEITDLLDK